MNNTDEEIVSYFWEEEPALENPFSASRSFCAGYDVYNDLLTKVSWVEFLYLMMLREQPEASDATLLNAVAVAIANPGPRDSSVQAAMSAAAGGSTFAACLMAAVAVGAGSLGGAKDVARAMDLWTHLGCDLQQWKKYLPPEKQPRQPDVWLPSEHSPGFDPHSAHCSAAVVQTLQYLSEISSGSALRWLRDNQSELELTAGASLALSGVVAAAFTDLGFEPRQGEMLFLLLRLPGAAVHALEQHEIGWRQFPFFHEGLQVQSPSPLPE